MQESYSMIQCGKLWTENGFLENHTVLIEAGKIADIRNDLTPTSRNTNVLDASDGIVIPGLVDLQVNGALGWSFQTHHRAHFDEIVQYHLRAGTTTLLPTLVTADADTLQHSLRMLAEYLDQAPQAGLPGIHLEGPFLAPEKSGAHDPAALRPPDLALTQQFHTAAQNRLKIVTLAPELPNAIPVIEFLAEQGVLVAAGHSAATYAEMQRAIQASLSFVTHAGNATDWPHRALGELGFMTSEPGVVGTLMAQPGLAGSIIMDGYHFHPALLAPLVQLKGPDQIVLVSDASTVTGCPPGDYESGGLQVTIHPAGFALSGRGGGWLAGSIITLLQAVQCAVKQAGITLHMAVHMASLGPARQLGIEQHKGDTRIGNDADLVILREDLSLQHVIVAGKVV